MNQKLNAIKEFAAWFRRQGKVYQTTIVIGLSSVFCLSVTYGVIQVVKTIEQSRYRDVKEQLDFERKRNAEEKLLSETREANQKRENREQVDYLKKALENCQIENRTMVKDAISRITQDFNEYKNQHRIYEEKLQNNAKK